MDKLQKLREIFLNDDLLDDDIREDNAERIKEWEHLLLENEAFLSWQQHDISKKIVAEAKIAYKEFGLQLATNRSLTQEQRQSLWAKQDACVFILSLTEKDARKIIEDVNMEIGRCINAT
jgi:hypothetical protein